MADKRIPSTMRQWKYNSSDGGIEKHLQLHTTEPLPKPKPDEHLVQVLAVSLNPVDFKPAEAGLVGRLLVKKPATPGFDFCGRIVTPADGSRLEPGQLVYGAASTSAFAAGGLAEYIAAPAKTVLAVPAGSSPHEFAGAPVAAITAQCALMPYIRSGSRVFINGGSGGVGLYTIQIAKVAGAHVTVSCSAKNAELCRSLGADEVLDYNARSLLDQLRDAAATSRPFDHVVDNVFSDPELYFQAHTYTSPDAKFAEVASAPSLAFLRFALAAMLLPRFLGGAQRKMALIAADIQQESLTQVKDWMVEGKVKTVIDEVFPMEDVVQAFTKLKTGRARGKIIVHVAGEGRSPGI